MSFHGKTLAIRTQWLACLGVLLFNGCDAIRSITGEEEPESEDVVSSEPSQPPEVGTPVGAEQENNNAPPDNTTEVAPPPTPEEILAAFLAKPTNARNDGDLEQLSQSPELLAGLTELDLSGGAVSNLGLRFLALFPALERLNLTGTRVTNDGLMHLSACSQLTALTLDNLKFVDEVGVREIVSLPLQEVSLRNTSVTESIFLVLSEFEQLQILHLDGNPNLTGIQFRGLTDKFEHLRTLSASNTQMGFGLQQIGQLNELEVLRIGHAEVADDVLEQLAQCRKLVELDLSDNPITLLGVQFLTRLNDLKQLKLRDCNGINDEALNNLTRLQSLEILDLTGTHCTRPAAEALKERLESTVVIFDDQEL